MAPKVKAKAKAKGKAKAVAKRRGRMRPKAKVRGGAVQGAGGRRRGILRRPGTRAAEAEVKEDAEALWNAGHTLRSQDAKLSWIVSSTGIVFEEASYFLKQIKLAGIVESTQATRDHIYLTLRPTGATEEGILRLKGANPNVKLRIHMCNSGCNAEETAEDLVHGIRVRARRVDGSEEA